MRSSITLLLASTLLLIDISGGQAFEEETYPNLKGQWARRVVPGLGQGSFDQTKSWGKGQQAPLTPEYEALFEAGLADQAAGGPGYFMGSRCIADGMPLMMIGFTPLEFIVTPETTYVLTEYRDHARRIFTDGRNWPAEIVPTFRGYSIGRWIDEDGDGRYDVLEVETRGPFKGIRVYDASGLPLHRDNQSIFRERIYLDKTNGSMLHDEITVFDNALTRPWTVHKQYLRNSNPRPEWDEVVCTENNALVFIGKESYWLSADGFLMPLKKNQPAPDLRYFKQTEK